MSQMNIQNLLSINPIEPIQPQQLTPQYRSSTFQGGGVQPGNLPTVVPNNEANMYMALAEIAQGISKGLDTFSNIVSRRNKTTMENLETEWERIDSQDVDPREKVKQMDEVLKTTSMPLQNENWKTRVYSRMAKNWGEDAVEKFAQDTYLDEVKQWSGYDGKMGPVKTQEFLPSFNEKYPSLSGTSFITALTKQTEADLREQEDLRLANTLTTGLEVNWAFDGTVVKGLAEKTLAIDELASTNPELAKAFELALGTSTVEEFSQFFTDGFYTGIKEQIDPLDPEVQEKAIQAIETWRTKKIADIWQASRIIKTTQNKQNLNAGVTAAIVTFSNSPNKESKEKFKTDIAAYLPDLSVGVQPIVLTQVADTILTSLASGQWAGYGDFAEKPTKQQIEIFRKELAEILPDGVLVSQVAEEAFGPNIKTPGDIRAYLVAALMTSEKGNALRRNIIDVTKATQGSVQAQIDLALANNQPIDVGQITAAFSKQLAKKTGISEEVWKSFFLKKREYTPEELQLVQEGKLPKDPPFIFNTDSVESFLNDPKNQEIFYPAGLNYAAMVSIKDSLSTLVQNTAKVERKQTGGTEFPALTVKTEDPIAIGVDIALKPGLVRSARLALSDPSYAADPNNPNYRYAVAVSQAADKMDSELMGLVQSSAISYLMGQAKVEGKHATALLDEQLAAFKKESGSRSTEEQQLATEFEQLLNQTLPKLYGPNFNKGMFEFDSSGQMIKPLTEVTYKENSNWIDLDGRLTPEGRLLGLRTQLMYQKLAAAPSSIEGSRQFYTDLMEDLKALSNSDLQDRSNRSRFYKVLYQLKGLRSVVTDPASIFGNTSQDYQVFNDLMHFVSTQPIPEDIDSGQLDQTTSLFLTGLDTGLYALFATDINSRISGAFSSAPGSSTAAAVRTAVDAYATGNDKAIFGTNFEGKPKRSDGTSGTLKFHDVFRFPIKETATDEEKAVAVLDSLYGYIAPIIAPGANVTMGTYSFNTVVPAPNHPGSFLIPVANTDSTEVTKVAWKDATPDQKLQYYMTLLTTHADSTEIYRLLTYPLIAEQVMGQNASVKSTPEERQAGIQALMHAKLNYEARSNRRTEVPSNTFIFSGSGGGWSSDPTKWGVEVQQAVVPVIETQDPRLQPMRLVQDAISGIGEHGLVLSFGEIEDKADESPAGEISKQNEILAEELGDMVHSTIADENARSGLFRGLQPVDQFVVGALSLPATEENIDYVFKTLNIPGTAKDLQQWAIYSKRMAKGQSVYEFLSQNFIGSQQLNTLNSKLNDFSLGIPMSGDTKTRDRKVKFGRSLNNDYPTLEYSSADGTYYVIEIREPFPTTDLMFIKNRTEGNEVILEENLLRYQQTMRLLLKRQLNQAGRGE